MIKIRDSFFIITFVGLLLLPMAGRLYAPLEKPYGQKPFTKIPDIKATLQSHSPKKFNALSTVLFERAPLTKKAISEKNKFLFNNFGYIDNDLIISGKDGWLFYKDQFNDGECIVEKEIIKRANRMRVLSALSQTIDVPIYFSISPNKSTIYPEKLSPRTHYLTNCVEENADLLRTIIRSRAPDIIDHAEPILAIKKRYKNKYDSDLYFHTDTHWNAISIYYAMRQLAGILWGEDFKRRFPEPKLAPEPDKKRKTDIASTILMIDPQDKFYNLKPDTIKNFADQISKHKDRLIILHDSFYEVSKYATYFSNSKLISRRKPSFYKEINEIALTQKPIVIVNSVERNFLSRIDELYERTKILENIIHSNLNLAKDICRYGPKNNLKDDNIKHTNMSVSQNNQAFNPQNSDPWIILNLQSPIAGRCIKIDLTTQETGTLEIFLPHSVRTANTPIWEGGRSFNIPVKKGANEIDFILPEELLGNNLRLDFNLKNTPIILKSTTLGNRT